MASSFWSNTPLFGGLGSQQQEDGIIKGKISKCNNMIELVQDMQADLDKVLELEAAHVKSSLTSSECEDHKGTQDGNGEEVTKNEFETHRDHLAARLARVKTLLYEDGDAKETGNAESESAGGLTHAFCANPSFVPKILTNISSSSMPFEARKDLAAIFNNLMVRCISSYNSGSDVGNSFAQYVLQNYDEVLTPLLAGHGEAADTALHCGSMLRSTLRHRALYQRLLSTSSDGRPSSSPAERYFYPLLDTYVHLPNFDVASDALATIRDILLTDRAVAAEFLDRDYVNIFSKYNVTLQSENYITRRMSLKLLVEILLDRSNFNVMMKYISSKDNLRIVMLLLSDTSPNIQFEAFHVFKIFVANPSKPEEIEKTLKQNKEKLVKYLQKFHVERESGDEQFREEKGLIIMTLSGLE